MFVKNMYILYVHIFTEHEHTPARKVFLPPRAMLSEGERENEYLMRKSLFGDF